MNANRCVYCKQNAAIENEKACSNLLCRTQMQLSEIPGLYVLAQAFLTPGKGGQGSSGSERTIGVNSTALEYRVALDLLSIISGWEVEVREQRAFSEMPTVQSYEERITKACEFLLTQFTWISTQEWFGDFVIEIADMHAKGKAATRQNQSPARRIECPADLDDGLCLSLLTLPPDGDKTATIKCHRCRTEWTIEWLIEVARETVGADYWLDAKSIANHLQMDHREVRRLAREWKIDKRPSLSSRAYIYNLSAFIDKYRTSKRDTPNATHGA